MSVRRLAEASVQPATFAFTEANVAWAQHTITKYPEGRQQSAVIPLLMRAQEQDGWVTKAAIEHVADMLSMPYIRVLEVATFYTQFQLLPVGTRAHVQVCGTTPCQLRGSEALIEVCRSKIHRDPLHTNASGTLSWEEVECQGACVNAPMVMIFKDTYEDLTPERLSEIIDSFDAGKGPDVPVGPQNGRITSSPITGMTSLQDETAVLKSTRDRQAALAAAETQEPAGASTPPSNAGRARTDAAETNPAIKSPSPVKAADGGEASSSVAAPAQNEAAANKAEPAVEMVDKQRSAAAKADAPASAYKAPETLKGEPIGPAGKDPDAPTPKPSRKKPV